MNTAQEIMTELSSLERLRLCNLYMNHCDQGQFKFKFVFDDKSFIVYDSLNVKFYVGED